ILEPTSTGRSPFRAWVREPPRTTAAPDDNGGRRRRVERTATMPAQPLPPHPPLITLMGVSRSRKTPLGAALARRPPPPFPPAANIAKLSAGVPLDDHDRMRWLRAIGNWLAEHSETGGVMSCSALKHSYRDVLRAAAPSVTFLHLAGDPEVIIRRVTGRVGH